MGREVTGELTRDCSSVVEKKAEEFLPQAFPQVCLGERQEEGSLGSGPSPATGLLLVTVGKTSALLDLPPPPHLRPTSSRSFPGPVVMELEAMLSECSGLWLPVPSPSPVTGAGDCLATEPERGGPELQEVTLGHREDSTIRSVILFPDGLTTSVLT